MHHRRQAVLLAQVKVAPLGHESSAGLVHLHGLIKHLELHTAARMPRRKAIQELHDLEDSIRGTLLDAQTARVGTRWALSVSLYAPRPRRRVCLPASIRADLPRPVRASATLATAAQIGLSTRRLACPPARICICVPG